MAKVRHRRIVLGNDAADPLQEFDIVRAFDDQNESKARPLAAGLAPNAQAGYWSRESSS